jgi:hypothetical protein
MPRLCVTARCIRDIQDSASLVITGRTRDLRVIAYRPQCLCCRYLLKSRAECQMRSESGAVTQHWDR